METVVCEGVWVDGRKHPLQKVHYTANDPRNSLFMLCTPKWKAFPVNFPLDLHQKWTRGWNGLKRILNSHHAAPSLWFFASDCAFEKIYYTVLVYRAVFLSLFAVKIGKLWYFCMHKFSFHHSRGFRSFALHPLPPLPSAAQFVVVVFSLKCSIWNRTNISIVLCIHDGILFVLFTLRDGIKSIKAPVRGVKMFGRSSLAPFSLPERRSCACLD